MEQDYMTAIRKLLNVTDGEEVLTTYPTYKDGTRAVIFAVIPGDGTPAERMKILLDKVAQNG